MYIIAGLGNPEKRFFETRHNAGFRVIDIVAQKNGIAFTKTQFNALIGTGFIGDEKVMLVKPLTYMNNSCDAVQPLCDYYKINPKEELIVISDDTDLELGVIRIRSKGSAGGHNGLKGIISRLETDEFTRVKVGVGHRVGNEDQIDYVLSPVHPEEREILTDAEERAACAVCSIITDGMARAMNIYNTKKAGKNDREAEKEEGKETDKETKKETAKEIDIGADIETKK